MALGALVVVCTTLGQFPLVWPRSLQGPSITRRRRNLTLAPVRTQIFAGLLVGAMLPYWFSAMTMKSVGKAALAMVEEVRRQFNTIQGIMEGTARPDYRLCVEISTQVRLARSFNPSGAVPVPVNMVCGYEDVVHCDDLLVQSMFERCRWLKCFVFAERRL